MRASYSALISAILGGIACDPRSSTAAATPFDCRNILVDGHAYDLSSLDKEWDIEGRIPLKFNPCRPISYFNEACSKGSSFMCAMDPSSPSVGRANIGIPTELYHNPKNELVMLYSRGSFDINGFPFISLVRFECDRNSKETGPLEPVTDGSKYFLIWPTRAACKVTSTLNGGTFSLISGLLWFLLFALMFYLFIGFAYNYFIEKKHGWEAIPNYGFWNEVFDFIRELGHNLNNRLFNRGGYQQI